MSKNQKNKTLVGTALVASLASIGIHTYLALDHYKLKFGMVEGKSLCNVSDHFNCDVVAVSKYASLLHYPIASWAAFTHLILSLFLGLWFLQNSSLLLRISTYLSIFIAGMSLVMGGISSFALGTYCLFCMGTYLLSFIIAGSLFFANESGWMKNFGGDIKAAFTTHRWILFCLVLIPAGTVFSGSVIQEELLGADSDTLKLMIQDSQDTWQNNPVHTFSESLGLTLQADNSPAKVTIVEFADFLCPHCRVLAAPMHNFVLAHPGVRLIYKAFPLDGVCNEAPGVRKFDGVRCELVYATLCAQSLSQKGWATHEYIFSHQMDWDASQLDKGLDKMSSEVGLNSEQLKECMKKSETHQTVLDMAKEGTGIMGTPTVFVNGKELPHGNVLPVLDAVVTSLNP